MLERLDFKTIRFDKFSDTILIKGRKATIEIARDAFEALDNREYTGEEAVIKAVEQANRLNKLANAIPADDGKIHITAALMLGEGQFSELHKNKNGE